MNADEQIRLHAPRFLYPHMQRYEIVAIARKKGAHGAAPDLRVVDALAQQTGNAQRHVFFARAAWANGAGVFAAVTGIDRKSTR